VRAEQAGLAGELGRKLVGERMRFASTSAGALSGTTNRANAEVRTSGTWSRYSFSAAIGRSLA